MASVIVDDIDPRIRYSPRGQWRANIVCFACDVSSRDMFELRKDAFNSTWHAAPGAQLDFRSMGIDFNFSGSDAAVTFILFRRTDEKGRTLDDGNSNLFLSLDNGDRQRVPLTLDTWKPQELQRNYRVVNIPVSSAEPGNHTLNIQFTRNSAMEAPVTVALDFIRFKELSSNSSTQAGPDPPSTQEAGGSPTQSTSPSGSSSNPQGAQGRTVNIAKIVGPIAGVLVFVLLLLAFLLCWRRRLVEKRRRLKASIRNFKPVSFDPYPQNRPPNYQSRSPEDFEKSVPIYSLRGSPVAIEPLPPLRPSLDSIDSQYPRNSTDSPTQPSYMSYEQQWRAAASQKTPVSTVSDRKLSTGPPHFVVVNR